MCKWDVATWTWSRIYFRSFNCSFVDTCGCWIDVGVGCLNDGRRIFCFLHRHRRDDLHRVWHPVVTINKIFNKIRSMIAGQKRSILFLFNMLKAEQVAAA